MMYGGRSLITSPRAWQRQRASLKNQSRSGGGSSLAARVDASRTVSWKLSAASDHWCDSFGIPRPNAKAASLAAKSHEAGTAPEASKPQVKQSVSGNRRRSGRRQADFETRSKKSGVSPRDTGVSTAGELAATSTSADFSGFFRCLDLDCAGMKQGILGSLRKPHCSQVAAGCNRGSINTIAACTTQSSGRLEINSSQRMPAMVSRVPKNALLTKSHQQTRPIHLYSLN